MSTEDASWSGFAPMVGLHNLDAHDFFGKKGEDQIRHSALFELEGKKCLREAKQPNVDFQLYGTVGLKVAMFLP